MLERAHNKNLLAVIDFPGGLTYPEGGLVDCLFSLEQAARDTPAIGTTLARKLGPLPGGGGTSFQESAYRHYLKVLTRQEEEGLLNGQHRREPPTASWNGVRGSLAPARIRWLSPPTMPN